MGGAIEAMVDSSTGEGTDLKAIVVLTIMAAAALCPRGVRPSAAPKRRSPL